MRGVRSKRSTFCHKVNWKFGFMMGVRSKRSTFWGSATPKIKSGYQPDYAYGEHLGGQILWKSDTVPVYECSPSPTRCTWTERWHRVGQVGTTGVSYATLNIFWSHTKSYSHGCKVWYTINMWRFLIQHSL